jgi:hypothetical protein
MSNLGNLDKRLVKIEHDRHAARGLSVVSKYSDETNESAADRWMADHPGEPDPRTAPLTVFVVKFATPEGLAA